MESVQTPNSDHVDPRAEGLAPYCPISELLASSTLREQVRSLPSF